MWAERFHGGIVKTRYFLQGCLLIAAVYGCASQYIPKAEPEPIVPHSPLELRESVVAGDVESLKALFVGKHEKLLQAYGLHKHEASIGRQLYSYAYVSPKDAGLKAVEFTVWKEEVTDVALYAYE